MLPAPGDVAQTNHHRALPYARVPELMAKLAAHEGVAARALMFTILTAARSNEMLGAKWGEFDLDNAIWTVPRERMKNRQAHAVPLSAAVVELLRGLPREGDFVFVGMQKGAPLSAPGHGASAGAPGLRRDRHAARLPLQRSATGAPSARTSRVKCWSTRWRMRWATQASAPTPARKLFGKRRLLMEAWARFCTSPPAKGDVVPMRGTR